MSIEVKNLRKAIKKCKKNKCTYIVRYDNLIFRHISIGYNLNKNKYLLEININSNRSVLDNVTKETDKDKTTTLYEAIEFKNEYKLLFNALKKSTKLSKKEISNLIRNEITLSGNHKTFYSSYIPENKI